MRRQHAAVAAQEKVTGHAAERPFAQTAVAEGAGDDEVRLQIRRQRRELFGQSADKGDRLAVRLDAVESQPGLDVVQPAPGALRPSGLGNLDHMDMLHRLQERQRVGQRPARLAHLLEADQGLPERETGHARGGDEDRPPEGHHKVADFGLPGGEEGPLAPVESGDDEIGAAGFAGHVVLRRS